MQNDKTQTTTGPDKPKEEGRYMKRFLHFFKIVYEGRLMSCYLVSRIGRFPIVGPAMKRTIQFLCGLNGHVYDADWGYGGGECADVWCRHCDYFTQIPKTSLWFKRRESRELMDQVGKEFKE